MNSIPKLSKASGNMYHWVDFMFTHFRGECPHRCVYCYVRSSTAYRCGIYKGPMTMKPRATEVDFGTDRTIFIGHMTDAFASEWAGPSDIDIGRMLSHCARQPGNRYVFQTRNLQRLIQWRKHIPQGAIIGTTIETDNDALAMQVSEAPPPCVRMEWIGCLGRHGFGFKTFITIEPVLKFHDVRRFAGSIIDAGVSFVCIGADSKGHGLQEPTAGDLCRLIGTLQDAGVEIRSKVNLGRILPEYIGHANA